MAGGSSTATSRSPGRTETRRSSPPDRAVAPHPGRLRSSRGRMSEPLRFDPIAEAGRQWRRHWGARAVPSMQAVTSIMRAQQILLARLNSALEPTGLTFPRYEALMLLYYSREGALPLGKIGDRLQ